MIGFQLCVSRLGVGQSFKVANSSIQLFRKRIVCVSRCLYCVFAFGINLADSVDKSGNCFDGVVIGFQFCKSFFCKKQISIVVNKDLLIFRQCVVSFSCCVDGIFAARIGDVTYFTNHLFHRGGFSHIHELFIRRF